MIRYLLIFISLQLFLSDFICAQVLPPADGVSEGEQVLYRNEMNGGLMVHSSGFGAFFRKGKHATGRRMRFFEAELTYFRHPKSYRGVNPFEESARQYVYGKLNSFTVLRGGIGFNNVIHGKDRRKGVEVRYHSYIGPSIGFAKPVYLEIIVQDHQNSTRRTVTEKYDPQKHHLDNIYGKAPFTRGLGETKVHPGLYGKFGLSFEYSGYDDFVKAIETGVTIDVYTQKVPMMALVENQRTFLNFYIAFLIGKREF